MDLLAIIKNKMYEIHEAVSQVPSIRPKTHTLYLTKHSMPDQWDLGLIDS